MPAEYLDRAGREEFTRILTQVYDAGHGMQEAKDARYSVVSWEGNMANFDVTDMNYPVLVWAREPYINGKLSAEGSTMRLLQNELLINAAEPIADADTFQLSQTRYIVANPRYFSEVQERDFEPTSRAAVQIGNQLKEYPHPNETLLTLGETAERMNQMDPGEIAFLLSPECLQLGMDLQEPVLLLRPMTSDDLLMVRFAIGQVINLDER